MREYIESVLRRKKSIPYKPYVCKKTHRINTRDLSHTRKQKKIQFEYYDLKQCTLSQPQMNLLDYLTLSTYEAVPK